MGKNPLFLLKYSHMKKRTKILAIVVIAAIFLLLAILSTPRILVWKIEHEQGYKNGTFRYFPVTVDPKTKTITESDEVNTFLADQHSLLGTTVESDVGKRLWNIIKNVAITINNSPWYENIASVSGRFVSIKPGMRKEQVAAAFGDALKWNNKQKRTFITATSGASLPFEEGSFSPGLYSVSIGMAPEEVQTMVNNRFSNDVLSHYATSTEEKVPLNETLIIASLIQRETISNDGMRLLSGIIWNRLFKDMDLQIDSTLQYAKANKSNVSSWWPAITPNDKYISSPFNTYQHNGLPPAPISNPSVEAILAALNPIKTSCLYYLNDKQGSFHCSDTYADHLSLLEKYYGN